MLKIIRQALLILLFLTILTGVAYPLAVTGLAQILFPNQANGSLIGQPFADPKYFWGRPSATTPFANNSTSSTGSNLGPTNSALTDTVKQRIDALRAADPGNNAPTPVDLVTASGSGLDPEISPAAAQYQLARVARVRGRAEADVAKLVAEATEGRQLGILGYRLLARYRYGLMGRAVAAGQCDGGTCHLHAPPPR